MMGHNRASEMETAIQEYIDSYDDAVLKVALGAPGNVVILPGEEEPEETGQQWTTPSLLRAITNGIGLVVGSWEVDSFDLSGGQTSVTLSGTPVSVATMQVFRDGSYLRYLGVMPIATQTDRYYWSAGTKVIHFTTASTGWLVVHYLAQV